MNTRNLTVLVSIFIIFSTHLYSQKFWLTTYEFPYGPKTAITLVHDTCLFVGYQRGVLRSFNQGQKFEQTLHAYSTFSLFSSTAGKVYAGSSGKIFRTDNLGISWDSIPINTIYPVIQIIENNNGDLFAITGALTLQQGFVGDGVFFSDNQGLTWSQRNNGLGIYASCEHIATDKNGRLYLTVADEYITGGGGLFISENNGLNWEHIPVNIDGRSIIDNHINIGNTTGLSVLPNDSLYLSFSGVAVNVAVQMNIRKNIHDIRNTNFWQPIKISNSNIWWSDKVLNNIYCSKNGDRYSSNTNSINQGGTFFSKNNTNTWKRIDYGLGLDINNNRSSQFFAETSSGKIFMIQTLDERVYWADTSLISALGPMKSPVREISIIPNKVKKGEKLYVQIQTDYTNSKVSVYNLSGNLIYTVSDVKQDFEINTHLSAGIYFIVLENKNNRFVSRFMVI